jgi:hypothetical protein
MHAKAKIHTTARNPARLSAQSCNHACTCSDVHTYMLNTAYMYSVFLQVAKSAAAKHWKQRTAAHAAGL